MTTTISPNRFQGLEDNIWQPLTDDILQDTIASIIKNKLPALKKKDADTQKQINSISAIFLATKDHHFQSTAKKINFLCSKLATVNLPYPNQEGITLAAQHAIYTNNIELIKFLINNTHPFIPKLSLEGAKKSYAIALEQNKCDIKKELESFVMRLECHLINYNTSIR